MDNDVYIHSSFKGSITARDLLLSRATLNFALTADSLSQQSSFFFRIEGPQFHFSLINKAGVLGLARNTARVECKLSDLQSSRNLLRVWVCWEFDKIILYAGFAEDNYIKDECTTTPSVPPLELLEYAREQSLIPRKQFKSEESFREFIHTALLQINETIAETDAYKSYWNIVYSGNEIVEKTPKHEVEIQPMIHSMIHDAVFLNNVKVVPEYSTGEGNVDFLFMGTISDVGIRFICVECKLSSSKDILEGLLRQLPIYMETTKSKYGIYLVLNHYQDFYSDSNKFKKRIDIHLENLRVKSGSPFLLNTRTILINLYKESTASQRKR